MARGRKVTQMNDMNTTPAAAPATAQVSVTLQGVQFGNSWYSHERITGYTAEQLNSGDCKITGRAYMDWVNAAFASPVTGGAAPEAMQGQAVAVRYKNSNGRWRYLNFPFTKGWEFPPNLGTPEMLFASPAVAPSAQPSATGATAEQVLTARGVFKGADGLRRLAECQEFWDGKAYGTRLYFEDAIDGYLHRDVLRAAVAALDATPTGEAAGAAQPIYTAPLPQGDGALKRLESENADLRQWLCDVLKGLGNGSGAMPSCSMQFLSNIPEEVRLVVAAMRSSSASSDGKEPE